MTASNQFTELADKVVQAIQSVVGLSPVALHEPIFNGNEWFYVKDCLDTNFVSSVGKYVDRFERALEEYTGAKHVVAVVNGTAALHIALMLAGVKSGDEVLAPALTFVATANAISYCGASPHFVESNERTLGVDAGKLREYLTNHTEQRASQCVNKITGRVIRAVVPMHTFGHPVDLEAMLAIACDFNIALVEDAAESLGSYYYGKHTGTFGLLGTLSFNGNKIVTTGGGGAILTNNTDLARRAKHITTTAKVPHIWEYCHDEIGFNYRLPNLNAALGCAQMERIQDMLAAKRKLFLQYQLAFRTVAGATLMNEPPGCRSNFWLQALLLDKPDINQRNHVLQATNTAGLMTRPAWTLLSELPPYQSSQTMELQMAKMLSERLVNLPSSAILANK
jgi:perosamine synthetase